MRTVSAIIQCVVGAPAKVGQPTIEYPITKTQAYMVDTSLDTDADQFSIDIGDPHAKYGALLERDNEVRVNLYTRSKLGNIESLHTGIADEVDYDSDDGTLSIIGRDYSSVVTDTDTPPYKYRKVQPHKFIAERAQLFGIDNVRVAKMSEIDAVVTDGTEKEWQLWYRMARMRDMWLWFEPQGILTGDLLNYSKTPTYYLGTPMDGTPIEKWLPVQRVSVRKSTRGRKGEVWVYFENAKTSKTYFSKAVDTSINAWQKKPIQILTLLTAKDQADVDKRAGDELHDSIVAANEIEITVADPGYIIRQNYMAQINIPELEFAGLWFVVGVQKKGSMEEGFVQVVRLREVGFAINTVVPDTPVIQPDPAEKKITQTINTGLQAANVRWGNYFVEATNEWHNGWDWTLFLGVLMAICYVEQGGEEWRNIRESSPGAINGIEWFEMPTSQDTPLPPGFKGGGLGGMTLREVQDHWRAAFANSAGNPLNPFNPREAGIGPMQLTYIGYKNWADDLGWNDAKRAGEYDGGRWNPRSNIRVAGRAFREMLDCVHADPNKDDDIWRGVAAYNAGCANYRSAKGQAYAAKVKQAWTNIYKDIAVTAAVEDATSKPSGTQTKVTLNDGTVIGEIPADTPDAIKKAISWALGMLGDPYQNGGGGPHYDCSSFVTKAYCQAGVGGLDCPHPGYHGDNTDTLLRDGRFPPVTKDNLLPGDLVFFYTDASHVGMIVDTAGQFVHDPHTGDVVKLASVNDSYYSSNFYGARRIVSWDQQPVGDEGGKGKRRVLIQAGHADPKEPGFPEEGASGEKDFNISIRDKLVAALQTDPRFDVTSAPGDIPDDWKGDLALYIHADGSADPSVSGYSFGYGSAQNQTASLKWRAFIVNHWNEIAGHIGPNPAGDNYTEDESGYYGFHKTNANAELLMEHGFRSNTGDTLWMDSNKPAIAYAHYLAICGYFGFKPVPG